MRLFFDTNVLVSGFVTRGYSFQAIKDSVYRYEVYYTQALLKEFKRVMTGKFKLSSENIRLALDSVTRHFTGGISAASVEEVCRDPADNRILADALANQCDFLISGDQDLLVLRRHKTLQIVSVRDYWTLGSSK